MKEICYESLFAQIGRVTLFKCKKSARVDGAHCELHIPYLLARCARVEFMDRYPDIRDIKGIVIEEIVDSLRDKLRHTYLVYVYTETNLWRKLEKVKTKVEFARVLADWLFHSDELHKKVNELFVASYFRVYGEYPTD